MSSSHEVEENGTSSHSARQDRPRSGAAEQRDDLAAFPLMEMHPVRQPGSASQRIGLQGISQPAPIG